jgi:hypothetical protein
VIRWPGSSFQVVVRRSGNTGRIVDGGRCQGGQPLRAPRFGRGGLLGGGHGRVAIGCQPCRAAAWRSRHLLLRFQVPVRALADVTRTSPKSFRPRSEHSGSKCGGRRSSVIGRMPTARGGSDEW